MADERPDLAEGSSSRPIRVAVETHGCRLNQSEGEGMSALLADRGYELVDDAAVADVLVLNTCTITHQADADARARVRRQQRRAPSSQVVVTGCYANSNPDELSSLPGVAAVIGNAEKAQLAQVLEEVRTRPDSESLRARPRPEPQVKVEPLVRLRTTSDSGRGGTRWQARARPTLDLPVGRPRNRARAHLKIQDGCNYRCAFCIVPQVRGRNRSTPIDRLVEELDQHLDDGRPEVVLTGVHIGTYGWDFRERDGLAMLLEQLLARIELRGGHSRLRLGSLDPHELRAPLIELLARPGGGLCPHVHLPVQSGSDRILKHMRRAHRIADLSRVTAELRRRVPAVSIGSDLIAGFPGETEVDFQRSLDLFSTGVLDYGHVFPYSIRAGTEASELPEQIDEAVKRERVRRLRAAAKLSWWEFRRARVGERRDAIILRSRDRGGRALALTDNYIRVRLPASTPDAWLGRAAQLDLVGVDGDDTLAELSSNPT